MLINTMKILSSSIKRSKQQGATLITSMMMLLVMTIIGIAAVKMSSIDIIIAGNDQQRLMLMQETESELVNLSTPGKLLDPLIGEFVGSEQALFDADTKSYRVPEPRNPTSIEIITDLEKLYSCEGFSGLAVSMGPDVPPCRLYDFQVRTKKANSGAKELRRRGAGKEVPNIGKNSYLANQGRVAAVPN